LLRTFLHVSFILVAGFTLNLRALAFEVVHADFGAGYYAVIDGGTEDTLKEGMKVCFFDDDDDEEVFCGPIAKINATRAGVFTSEEKEAWLPPGTFAKVPDLGADHPRNQKPLIIIKEVIETSPALRTESPYVKPENRRHQWITGLVTTPVLPIQYAHPQFNILSRSTSQESIWESHDKANQSPLGVSLSYRGPIYRTLDHELAATWRYLQPFNSDSDYDPKSPSYYAIESTKATDATLSWSAIFVYPVDLITPYTSIGLGAESMSIRFAADSIQEGDDSKTIALASSTAKILATFARLSAGVEKVFGDPRSKSRDRGHGRFSFHIAALIPTSTRTSWSHETQTLPKDIKNQSAATDQYETAADVHRVNFGLEFGLSCGWAM
jgi:hypothetical protein